MKLPSLRQYVINKLEDLTDNLPGVWTLSAGVQVETYPLYDCRLFSIELCHRILEHSTPMLYRSACKWKIVFPLVGMLTEHRLHTCKEKTIVGKIKPHDIRWFGFLRGNRYRCFTGTLQSWSLVIRGPVKANRARVMSPTEIFPLTGETLVRSAVVRVANLVTARRYAAGKILKEKRGKK